MDILDKMETFGGLDLGSVRRRISAEQSKPLSAAIFGQTGCGKSSLTNAIFGTEFDVDDVKPCTKEPQSHESVDREGHLVTFWDLPGIGESGEADSAYLDMYAKYAEECDVVLWAFQADTRAMTLDAAAFESIVERLDGESRRNFLNRLTVVVTKADLISTGPWIFARSGSEAVIAASCGVEETLHRKSEYFFDELLGEHQSELEHRTFVSSSPRDLARLSPDFWLDENRAFLYHRGRFPLDKYNDLVSRFPGAKDELQRLLSQSRAVFCSARLKFNLNAVKAQLAQKGQGSAILRLHQSVDRRNERVAWDDLKDIGLPVFWDAKRNSPIFNISEMK